VQGQGVQLAADAEQEIRPGDAGLLAQNNGASIMPIPMRPGLMLFEVGFSHNACVLSAGA
jgi:hypothetical protein